MEVRGQVNGGGQVSAQWLVRGQGQVRGEEWELSSSARMTHAQVGEGEGWRKKGDGSGGRGGGGAPTFGVDLVEIGTRVRLVGLEVNLCRKQWR